MASYAKVYLLYALSPLHVGVGQGLGFIDLPIMREKSTNWPVVPGSSVKGVWRDQLEMQNNPLTEVIFGKGDTAESSAGSIVVTDAKIAFLPVRSLFGTFAYVTSPLVLNRLVRDLAIAFDNNMTVPQIDETNRALATKQTVLLEDRTKKAYLEELDLLVSESDELDKSVRFLAQEIFSDDDNWQKIFSERVLLVSDTVFDYLSLHATQVVTRTKINPETNIVDTGALWNEESLPAETILMGVLWCDRVLKADLTPKDLLESSFAEPFICQIGGNETIGAGRVKCIFAGGKEV